MNNRKNIPVMICFLIVLLFANISFSQFKNFGIKAGLNLSGAKIDYSTLTIDQPKNKIGFNAGLFYDFLNFNDFIISGEAVFSNRGYKVEIIYTNEFGIVSDMFNATINLNYIDLSLSGKYIIRKKSVSPYLTIGPVFSFYTGNSVTAPRSENSLEEFFKPFLDKLDKTTFGIKGGVGIEINKVIPQTLITEVRYYVDLKESFNNGFVTFKRNMMWELNLGIKF